MSGTGYPPGLPPPPKMEKKPRHWIRKTLTFGAFLFVGLIIGIGLGGGGKNPAPTPTPVPSGSASTTHQAVPPSASTARPAVAAPKVIVISNPKTFGDEFDKNKVVATKKYKGHQVQIVATLSNVNDDNLSFGGVTSDEFSMTQISCRLADESQAEKVENGKKYTIVGTVTGQDFGVIGLSSCAVK